MQDALFYMQNLICDRISSSKIAGPVYNKLIENFCMLAKFNNENEYKYNLCVQFLENI